MKRWDVNSSDLDARQTLDGKWVDYQDVQKLEESHNELLKLLSDVVGYSRLTYRPSDDVMMTLNVVGSDFNRIMSSIAKARGLQ